MYMPMIPLNVMLKPYISSSLKQVIYVSTLLYVCLVIALSKVIFNYKPNCPAYYIVHDILFVYLMDRGLYIYACHYNTIICMSL